MMKDFTIRFGMILILLFSVQSCVAGAKSSQPDTITGTITVVGSEPLTYVVLRTDDGKGKNTGTGDYLITGPLVQELRRNFQGKVVVLEGKFCTSPSPQFTKCFKASKVIVD